MKDEFKTSSKHQQDGMIVTLLTQGASQASIRGLFEVGGYRINRLSQCMGMTAEEKEERINKSHKPKHALDEEDMDRLRSHIDSYDLEPGYPCAHRQAPLYFHFDDAKTHTWKDIHNEYTESLQPGQRIISYNR